MIRALEQHDFQALHEPFVACPSPYCGALCATPEQYHRHMRRCDPALHPGSFRTIIIPPTIANAFMMLMLIICTLMTYPHMTHSF